MALERTPIFRNLDYQTSWFGLTFDDLPFILAPIGAAMLGMIFFGLSPTVVIVVAAATLVGLIALKYNKPKGYLWLLLQTVLLPRHLSSKVRDTQMSPLSRLPRTRVRRGRTAPGDVTGATEADRQVRRARP